MKVLRSLFPSLLWGVVPSTNNNVPVLQSQSEVVKFLEKHERALLCYTTRLKSAPDTYNALDAAIACLEQLDDDDSPIGIAEVIQKPFPDNYTSTVAIEITKGDNIMSLEMNDQQQNGFLNHIGTAWTRFTKEGIMLVGAEDDMCPEHVNSLVLQFRDCNDPPGQRTRRHKQAFLQLNNENSVERIVEFCLFESFRSNAWSNVTQGLTIWATRNATVKGLFGFYPSVSKVGALHLQVNDVQWSRVYPTLESLGKRQLESNIGILVERIVGEGSILLYEAASVEEEPTVAPLKSAQQIQDLYDGIRERDAATNNDNDGQRK